MAPSYRLVAMSTIGEDKPCSIVYNELTYQLTSIASHIEEMSSYNDKQYQNKKCQHIHTRDDSYKENK